MERAVSCLKENPAVTEILQDGTYTLRARMEPGEEDLTALTALVLREMIGRNVPVCDFHRAPMNLEKVFMEVTQSDA